MFIFLSGFLPGIISFGVMVKSPNIFIKYEKREIHFKATTPEEFAKQIADAMEMRTPIVKSVGSSKLIFYSDISSALADRLWFMCFEKYSDDDKNVLVKHLQDLSADHGGGGQQVSTISFICTNEDISGKIDNRNLNQQGMHGTSLSISFQVNFSTNTMFYMSLKDGPYILRTREIEKKAFEILKKSNLFDEIEVRISK